MPFETMLAKKALHARVEKEMPKTVPIAADAAAYAAGAQVYRDNCAVCHGLPNQPKTAIATGEYPAPPQLFQGKGVTDDPAGETYWKAENGIRLTGMPGFGKSLSTTQMWPSQLVAGQCRQVARGRAPGAVCPAAGRSGSTRAY
jgi:thiosulfate dehydrogenase